MRIIWYYILIEIISHIARENKTSPAFVGPVSNSHLLQKDLRRSGHQEFINMMWGNCILSYLYFIQTTSNFQPLFDWHDYIINQRRFNSKMANRCFKKFNGWCKRIGIQNQSMKISIHEVRIRQDAQNPFKIHSLPSSKNTNANGIKNSDRNTFNFAGNPFSSLHISVVYWQWW